MQCDECRLQQTSSRTCSRDCALLMRSSFKPVCDLHSSVNLVSLMSSAVGRTKFCCSVTTCCSNNKHNKQALVWTNRPTILIDDIEVRYKITWLATHKARPVKTWSYLLISELKNYYVPITAITVFSSKLCQVLLLKLFVPSNFLKVPHV